MFFTSCSTMTFGEIGQFVFIDDLPVSLLMEFHALLNEYMKLMLLTVSIQCSHHFSFMCLYQCFGSCKSLVCWFLK